MTATNDRNLEFMRRKAAKLRTLRALAFVRSPKAWPVGGAEVESTVSVCDYGLEFCAMQETESSEGMTLEEVAQELGVSRERVRQIERKAMRKIRNLRNWKLTSHERACGFSIDDVYTPPGTPRPTQRLKFAIEKIEEERRFKDWSAVAAEVECGTNDHSPVVFVGVFLHARRYSDYISLWSCILDKVRRKLLLLNLDPEKLLG